MGLSACSPSPLQGKAGGRENLSEKVIRLPISERRYNYMSGFGFSEEQEMFRKTMRDFSRKEIAPGSKERAKQELQKGTVREWLKRLAAIILKLAFDLSSKNVSNPRAKSFSPGTMRSCLRRLSPSTTY